MAGILGLSALGNMLSREDDATGVVQGTTAPTDLATVQPAASTAPVTQSRPTPTVPTFAPSGATQIARVTRVTDGDTIRVEIDGTEYPVRYIGVDTPEPDDPDPVKRALANRATAANAALVEGREVVLERDVSDVDRFDRLLRDVWIEGPDGAFLHVGLELIRTGFAQVSTYPPDVKYVDRLLVAQSQARTAEAGLWAPTPTPVPTPQPVVVVEDALGFVGTEERTRFDGAVGDYTWSTLLMEGDRLTVRWDVHADDVDCRVGWRLEPDGSDVVRSTIRVDAGGRERDNRRYDIDFDATAFVVASTCPKWVMTMQTADTTAAEADCDSSYPGVCIPPYPPDLDCPEIPFRNFEVRGSDPHGFDREGDGLGCEG